MMKSVKNLVYGIISFAAIAFIWWLLAINNIWSEQVFPSPITVMYSFNELLMNGTLVKHSIASLYRVTMGFDLGVLFGVPLGILLGLHPLLKKLVEPLIQFLRPISPLAWIPLAMLWFGIGDKPAIFLIFLSSFFPIVVATVVAVESINPLYFRVAANFNFSRREILQNVIFPSIVPELATALRLTVAIAWLVVVAAEMIAVQSGLGYLILDSRNALRMDYVMVGMIVVGVIGLLLDAMMCRLISIEYIRASKVS